MYPFKTVGLAPGVYYWSVQSVDGGMLKSGWAQEQSFMIGNASYSTGLAGTEVNMAGMLTTGTTSCAVVTIGNNQKIKVGFNMADSELVVNANLSIRLKSGNVGSNLVVTKLAANDYNKGTDLIKSYGSYSVSVCELMLVDKNGTVISNDGSAFAENPVLSFSVAKQGYSDAELKKLRIMTFDSTQSKWVSAGQPIITMSVDSVTVTCAIEHFSVYGMFFVPSLSFSSTAGKVIVYPNPYVPNDGNSVNGTPDTGILFDNIPAGSTIEIFTVDGSRVTTLSPDSSPFKWDVKTGNGDTLASGVYLYLLKSPAGNKSGKIAVVK
jgi:hypothetical protein